jgi:hypothetical protein
VSPVDKHHSNCCDDDRVDEYGSDYDRAHNDGDDCAYNGDDDRADNGGDDYTLIIVMMIELIIVVMIDDDYQIATTDVLGKIIKIIVL